MGATIAYLSGSSGLGGAERALLDTMLSFRAAHDSVRSYLIAPEDGPLLRPASESGIAITMVPMPRELQALGDEALGGGLSVLKSAVRGGAAALRYALRLRAALAEIAPDVVHSNSIKHHLLSAAIAPSSATPVWHVHDFIGARRIRPLLALAARRAAGALAISNAVARDLQSVAPRLPTRVLYNGIDVESFSPGRAEPGLLDRLAGLPPLEDGIRIGLVATFAKWKGHRLFLRAASRVEASRRVRYYVVGGPIYRTHQSQVSIEELRHEAQILGIADRVGFVPFQEEIGAVYQGLDVVVHASTAPEPFGRTIVEAMACGRPVIVARAGGAAELFTDGVDALGFGPGDADGLAAAMKALIESDERRATLGAAGRRTAVARFSRARLGIEVASAYRDFAAGARYNRGALA